MGRPGCNLDGNLNDAKFSEPMPWIGAYIAAASLACLVPMAVDAVNGFRHKKFWFPCKFFSLNSTSLTLIAVAIKLPVDLNTSMPRRQDQLAKLTSAVFMCTVMANSMPSLGTMENKEILMNIMALGILVITLVVNICIQLGTGVIYVYWQEHALIMFFMLVLLVIMSFSALTIPTTKRYLESKYTKKYELALKDRSDETGKTAVEKLRDDLKRFWMMAHSSSPQFVMGRSATCTASGAICLLSTATLAEAVFRSYFMPWSFKYCDGESDYKWSTTLVLVVQMVTVGVGTIGPTFRWFAAINFRCPIRGKGSYKQEFTLERYWIQSLLELKECSFASRIHGRLSRKIIHDARNKFLDMCIKIQAGIVLASKVIRLISILVVGRIMSLRFRSNVSNVESGSESSPALKLDLSHFVLHLEGENELVQLMIKRNCDTTSHGIHSGKKRQPKHLIKLLEEASKVSLWFKGVVEFDSEQVPSLASEEPPNCWALPLVTLTSIAIALPNTNNCSIKQLIHGVNEGLSYVKLIEYHLDTGRNMTNVRKAAEIVRVGVDLYHKWLDVDLRSPLFRTKNTRHVLEELAEVAKKRYVEFKNIETQTCSKEAPSNWPAKILAANSMYRISQTLLMKFQNKIEKETLSEEIVQMITDILGACFCNIQRVISIKCLKSAFEEREDSVREAANILGETEEIMKLLCKRRVPCLDCDQMASIDEWRLVLKLKNRSSMEDDIDNSSTDEFCLNID